MGKARIIVNSLLSVTAVGLSIFMSFWIVIISAWPINDDLLPTMNDSEWASDAMIRIVGFSIVSVIYGLVVYLVAKTIIYLLFRDKSPKFAKKLALASFAFMELASIAGGIYFWIEKPYM